MASAKKLKPAKPGKKPPSTKKKPLPAARKGAAAKSAGKGKVKVVVSAAKKTPPGSRKPAPKKKLSPAMAASSASVGAKAKTLKKKKPAGRKTGAHVTKKALAVRPKKPVRKKPASAVTPTTRLTSKRRVATAEVAGDRLRILKAMLLAKRNGILKEAKEEIAKYMSGDNRQLVDTAIDEGDWAVVDISEDLSLRRLDSHRQLLLDIDESLRKIQEGTYGLCEECGEEISEKRLNVIPTATLCIDCKENREKMDALELTPEL